MSKRASEIKALCRDLKSLEESEENQRRKQVQQRLNRKEVVRPVPFNAWSHIVGFPIVVLAWSRRLGRSLDMEAIARETGPISPDLAAELVEFQLLAKIENFKTVPDDIPLSLAISTNLGLCWLCRPGPLGERYQTDPSSGAFVPQPIVKEESDLDKLQRPHFRFDRSLHEARVAVFKEIVDGELPVGDDALPRGPGAPFSTANNLRGVLELLLDMKDRPDFVHRLMGIIVEAILTYNREAREAVGGARLGTFGCDEVSCDMFSPQVYEEFIFPYECQAAAAFDSIYYHSCGNLTPLFGKIVQIPHIHRVHVSPWSDLATAIREAGGKVILEKHLEPTVNLDRLSREEMRTYVKQVTDLGTEYPLDMVVPVQTPGGRLYREIFYEETQGGKGLGVRDQRETGERGDRLRVFPRAQPRLRPGTTSQDMREEQALSSSDRDQFLNPPAEFRMLPGYGGPWRQEGLGKYQSLGFGGVLYDMRNPGYLFDEKQWKEYQGLVEEAKERGMYVWIYDEDGFPSGAGGGEVLANYPQGQALGLYYSFAFINRADRATLKVPWGKPVYAKAASIGNGVLELENAI